MWPLQLPTPVTRTTSQEFGTLICRITILITIMIMIVAIRFSETSVLSWFQIEILAIFCMITECQWSVHDISLLYYVVLWLVIIIVNLIFCCRFMLLVFRALAWLRSQLPYVKLTSTLLRSRDGCSEDRIASCGSTKCWNKQASDYVILKCIDGWTELSSWKEDWMW